MNPLCLAVSLVCVCGYSASLRGKKSLLKRLAYLVPMAALAIFISAAFNHAGVTSLLYLPSGNPLTLESILYGVASAAMLTAMLLWFSCYGAAMTSDKFIYLFGRIIPALSLVLSMSLRFVPKFKAQYAAAADGERALRGDASQGPILARLKRAAAILSIVVTWALDNAVETADSMKSRGYGLPHRSSFSIYRFEERDRYLMLWLTFCGLYITSGWLCGGFYFRYFPSVKWGAAGPFGLSFLLCYLALCLTPIILNVLEARKWTRLKSKA
ncbi:Energy-coupling factor transporter transmembrane protein EcfT [bioreactor metagenome]|uniref:Energy-coupling factor transporter transmembrane protein EcfT n=1 Tax=bioreactor metagenome TaxID=1076179 RepID=A0A644XVK7_9ZZZZ